MSKTTPIVPKGTFMVRRIHFFETAESKRKFAINTVTTMRNAEGNQECCCLLSDMVFYSARCFGEGNVRDVAAELGRKKQCNLIWSEQTESTSEVRDWTLAEAAAFPTEAVCSSYWSKNCLRRRRFPELGKHRPDLDHLQHGPERERPDGDCAIRRWPQLDRPVPSAPPQQDRRYRELNK